MIAVDEEEVMTDPVMTAEAVMEVAGALVEQALATLGLETGSATFLTAVTPTSAGGTNATNARHPSQKGLEAEMAEVRFQTLKVINCL